MSARILDLMRGPRPAGSHGQPGENGLVLEKDSCFQTEVRDDPTHPGMSTTPKLMPRQSMTMV